MSSSGPVPGWPSTEAAKALRFRVQILKAVAFVVLFPFMFVSPRLTMSVLSRIDRMH
jgi:hypothetical protein